MGENPNTKRELKEIASAIRSLVTQITTSAMVELLGRGRLSKTAEAAAEIVT